MRTAENRTENNLIFDSESEKNISEKDQLISQLLLKNEELSSVMKELFLDKENLINQNEELSGKNEELSGKNEELSGKNEELSGKNEELSGKNEELSGKNEELTIKIEYYAYQIAQLKRMLFGSKRERFVSNENPEQLTIPFEVEAEKVKEYIESEKEKITYERSKERKQHSGREKLPEHLPVEEIILEPEEDTNGMTYIGDEITEELEYKPAIFYKKRYIRRKYITQEDERGIQRQVIAELQRPIAKCMAGSHLLSEIVINKFVDHLPIYRQLQRFIREDIHIKSSTMESWLKLTSQLLRPLYGVLKAYVLETGYLQVDESPIPVLDRDKPGATHQGYMWVYHSVMQQALFFEYNKGRGQESPKKNLANFKGYLQTDGYVVYDQYNHQQDITHLSCWVHARRYFEKALGNDKVLATTVLLLIQELYAIEQKARDENLSNVALYELRLNKSLPVLNKIGKYIAENRKTVLPKSPIGIAFDYCLERWDSLLNYLKDGYLLMDNNLIENAIRPLALGRKNYLFAGSHNAAEDIAMYYSFFATCKKHDLNPKKWLVYVIEHINDYKISELHNLLPQFFDKSLLD